MANHKKREFASTDQHISAVAKALSHPARIAILRILAQNKHFTCGEIVGVLPLAQPTVSHHLKELLDSELITVAIDGKRSLYNVNWNSWNIYTQELDLLIATMSKAS
ncbi:metalloregulator ArsR/SmtB family transcription factor [Mucilaginibacter sabulilitoris]|uniref:Metalloregulator ArsR/SmtB family transcription factor n=1 Tax=Mucilaginibacter sabulilitoris TaxID=1173583 RepID=A0ABZ0THF9_9SPHI|nr:metalloregulator ArsR/SmtB family transcription factor [Mucilaginibacter sabulilitoris]WPU92031.1 metalloregulator ArsR/SmtB family transcription factor [Mucilaginibacter sabulilitoris]